jgi:polygalacturonase
MKKISLLLLCYAFFQLNTFSQSYNIRDFGAVTDSTRLNTKSIQSAIDRCFINGGGEVIIPAGTYYTGTLFLKSNVYLRLLPGSVLQGSYHAADYPEYDISLHKKFGTITHDGLFVKFMKALIIADNAQNIGITGEGTIKGAGEGEAFQLGLNKDGKPKNIFFIGCSDVTLKGIRVFNAAQVTISLSKCERVLVDGLYIRSLVNWNCDGLDVDARDAVISNCIIETEDDALCFKSEYLNSFCENISVSNCVVSSICNGIKIGTGSRTGFRNITVDNCVIKKTKLNDYFHWKMTPDMVIDEKTTSVNTGIVILGVDGGIVENINFSNIVMTDVLSPFFIRIAKRFLNPDGKPSVMRNISIQNVIAETRSIIPSIIAGLEESPAQDIRISNVRIVIPIVVPKEMFKNFPAQPAEDTKGYPENRLSFGLKLPASAFYIRHVDGISLSEITVTCDQKESRPAFYFDDARNIRLRNAYINNQTPETNHLLIGKLNTGELNQ